MSDCIVPLTFSADEATVTLDFGAVSVVSGETVEPYTGDYEVDPDFTGRTLATNGKRMTADVTVNPIEVARVSNTGGGKTVYIGGIINGE